MNTVTVATMNIRNLAPETITQVQNIVQPGGRSALPML